MCASHSKAWWRPRKYRKVDRSGPAAEAASLPAVGLLERFLGTELWTWVCRDFWRSSSRKVCFWGRRGKSENGGAFQRQQVKGQRRKEEQPKCCKTKEYTKIKAVN